MADYIAEKKVRELLKEATTALLESKPDDPKAFLADHFQKRVSKFQFESGNPDCCSSNPEYYKVVAEIPGRARLVEMVVPPGGEDAPHEHPTHSMYFVAPAKLSIRDMADGKLGDPHEAELPAGAAPIFPPGGHQVKNIGDSDSRVIFVESYPGWKPSGGPETFVTPFEKCDKFYQKLAEDDEWITGVMTMQPGEIDDLHNHRDHLIYVIEGDELTIYPDGNMEDPHAVPIQPFKAIPAPVAAGSIFTNHVLKNTGKGPAKLVFFESKV